MSPRDWSGRSTRSSSSPGPTGRADGVTRQEETRGESLPPGEQAKLRFYFISGSLIGGLGVVALAAGEFRTGTTSLAIGLAALVLGVKRGQAMTAAIAGPTKAQAKTTKTQAKTKTRTKTRTRSKAEAAPY